MTTFDAKVDAYETKGKHFVPIETFFDRKDGIDEFAVDLNFFEIIKHYVNGPLWVFLIDTDLRTKQNMC